MRIFHFEMLVNSYGLAQEEKKLGHTSHLCIRKKSLFNLDIEYNLEFDKGTVFSKIFRILSLFFRIRRLYDVFHFQFGSSLLDFDYNFTNHLDLRFYPKKTKLVFTFNGDDARLQYSVVDRIDFNEILSDYLLNKNHFNRNRRIAKIKKVDKYAHHIFAVNPDLLNFLPARAQFIPYIIPNFYSIQRVSKNFNHEKFNVVHAPSNKDVKGTKFILSALEYLKSKYPFIEVILVENVRNDLALQMYQKADLVIDQVIIGWYGALSVEVMKMGIPVACYLRKEDFHHLPDGMAQDLMRSMVNISPLNIIEPIEKLILNRMELANFSNFAYEYVNKWHDPAKIAEKIISIYRKL
ncbi:MAG: hypothetical protein ABIO44_13635 [Saprospiraceae bacterium]